MPAAHFDKSLEDWACHARHNVLISPKVSPNYSVKRFFCSSFLDTADGITVSIWSHYLVTVGGCNVTGLSRVPISTTGMNLLLKVALP